MRYSPVARTVRPGDTLEWLGSHGAAEHKEHERDEHLGSDLGSEAWTHINRNVQLGSTHSNGLGKRADCQHTRTFICRVGTVDEKHC